jgi:lipopolysaccharide cholinephosphotransferase
MQQTDFDKRIQSQILHVFKFTVKFLEKHSLRYVACGGTVLGAVRHKGFIPWDDDMDIYMPRADYEKLLDLKKEAMQDGFEVLSLRDKGYYLPFAKVSDMHTSLWEFECFPFVMGVYIDIFPLDNFNFSDNQLEAIQHKSEKMFYHYMKSISKEKTFDFWKDIFHGLFSQARYKLKVLYLHLMPKKLFANFLDYQKWYSNFDGPKSVCVTQWAGKIFKREWFEDTITLPFEDTEIIVPRDYDSYLTCLYGDYMTPPPVEQQVSEHQHFYLNFNERLSLEEIKQRMKNEGV